MSIAWVLGAALLAAPPALYERPDRAIQAGFQLEGGENARVSVRPADLRRLPKTGPGIAFGAKLLGYDRARHTASFEVTAFKRKRKLATRVLVLSTEEARAQVVAARSLPAGSKLMQSDLKVEWTTSRPGREVSFKDPSNLIGKVLQVGLAPNRPIQRRHITEEAFVHRGQRVKVRAIAGSLVVSMTAECMEDGAEGAFIRLVNTESGRTLRGRVIARGEVEVSL